ncbi:MAG: alginate export family protein [Candidatus Omnitrophota bacterium]
MKQLRVLVFAVVLVVASCSLSLADILKADDIIGDADLSVGAAVRIRHEDSVNAYDLDSSVTTNDPRTYFRTRTNLWALLKFSEFDSLKLMLTNEFRNYILPDDSSISTRGDSNEVNFDNFYVQMDEVMESPVSLTLGRQNLIYGEGFLLFEGTPGDGSRTIYFDALKASVVLTESETLDLIYISNDKKDKKLPHDGAFAQSLNTTDETGIVLYLKSKLSDELNGELYFMNKVEEAPVGSSDLKINTLGAFGKYAAEIGTVRGQFALQDGDKGTVAWEGFGGYLFFDKKFDVAKAPMLSVGGLWLSGDDPATANKFEGFNPLWSRYPYLNELYSYVVIVEGNGLCYWTNTALYTTRLTLEPIEKMSMTLAIDYIMAMEKGTANSDVKGLSPHLTVGYAMSPTVSWKSQLFLFKPGNYYSGDSEDTATFIRHEWNIKF